MKGRTFTYTLSDEVEVRRIEEKLRKAGIKFETKRTTPRTFVTEDEEVTVCSARPFNITVAAKHQERLSEFVKAVSSGAK
jgi:hypothetical protein